MKLQNKFLAILFPSGLAAAGLILFLIQRSVRQAILNDLRRNVVVVAKAAAQDAAPDFQSENEAMLLPRLQSLQNREGALYVAALDVNGRILAHTNIKVKGAFQNDPATRAALRSSGPSASILSSSGTAVLEIAVPVYSPPKPASQDAFLLSGEPRGIVSASSVS